LIAGITQIGAVRIDRLRAAFLAFLPGSIHRSGVIGVIGNGFRVRFSYRGSIVEEILYIFE